MTYSIQFISLLEKRGIPTVKSPSGSERTHAHIHPHRGVSERSSPPCVRVHKPEHPHSPALKSIWKSLPEQSNTYILLNNTKYYRQAVYVIPSGRAPHGVSALLFYCEYFPIISSNASTTSPSFFLPTPYVLSLKCLVRPGFMP